jgi:CheY-like chemotaxis protein
MMAGQAILIVDDNPTNLKLVRILLQGEGYDVRIAADAEEALEVLKSFHPRLILMDVQLPGMDGLELTKRLKANPDTREITIIALTAYAMKGDEQKALDAGCDGYIAKPIDTRSLPALVADHLMRARVAGNPADSTRSTR